MKIDKITFTGADNNTNLLSLKIFDNNISNKIKAEFGILFSKNRVGKARYPNLEWVDNLKLFKEREGFKNSHFSAHLCGEYVKELFTKSLTLYNSNIFSIFERIQLNIPLNLKTNTTKEELNNFKSNVDCLFPKQQIIFQITKDKNLPFEFLDSFTENNHKIAVLFDSSGGNGVNPEKW